MSCIPLILTILGSLLLGACAPAVSDDSAESTAHTIPYPAFLLFYTDNWLPWEQFTPIVDGLLTERPYIHFERINVGDRDNEAFQRTFGLRGHPSWVLLDAEGMVVEQQVGAVSAEILIPIFNQISE